MNGSQKKGYVCHLKGDEKATMSLLRGKKLSPFFPNIYPFSRVILRFLVQTLVVWGIR